MDERSLATMLEAARKGELDALEQLIAGVQNRIYGIAVRMLGHPQDAQDATQEILLKIVTHLSTFRAESSVMTWVSRIAVNHLLTMRKKRSEQTTHSFEALAEQINAGLSIIDDRTGESADQPLLVEEMKIHCTQGMLLCLDQEHRIAYILGEVFEVSSQEGADILEIRPDLFRQRLARARKSLRAFMQGTCGLVNPDNPCRCRHQAHAALKVGQLDAHYLPFASHPVVTPTNPQSEIRQELATLDRIAAIFRGHPRYAAPDSFVQAMKALLISQQFRLLKSTNTLE